MQIPDDVEVSSELKDLISRMLIKNPNNRITLKDIKVIYFLGCICANNKVTEI